MRKMVLLVLTGIGKTQFGHIFAINLLHNHPLPSFFTAYEVVSECRKAESKGRINRLVNKSSRPHLPGHR